MRNLFDLIMSSGMQLLLALHYKINRKTAMLYNFLRVLVRISLKIFFRKTYTSGTENVKKDRPQLIESNQLNGFLGPF